MPKLVFDEPPQEVLRPLERCAAPRRFREGFRFAPHLDHAIRTGLAVIEIGPERFLYAGGIAAGHFQRRSDLVKQTAAVDALTGTLAIANQR